MSAELISSHVRPERGYRPRSGEASTASAGPAQGKSLPVPFSPQSVLAVSSRQFNENRLGRVLAVRHRRAPVLVPLRGLVRGFGQPSAGHVEEDLEAVCEEGPGGLDGMRNVRG